MRPFEFRGTPAAFGSWWAPVCVEWCEPAAPDTRACCSSPGCRSCCAGVFVWQTRSAAMQELPHGMPFLQFGAALEVDSQVDNATATSAIALVNRLVAGSMEAPLRAYTILHRGRAGRLGSGYLVFRVLVASFHNFTAMPGSFTKSVVHPHSRQ